VANIVDYLLLYAKNLEQNKHRKAFRPANLSEVDYSKYTRAFTPGGIAPIPREWREDPSLFEPDWCPFRSDITLTQDGDTGNAQVPWEVQGKRYLPGPGRHWRTHEAGRQRLHKAGRVNPSVSRPFYIEGYDDSPATASSNIWTEDLAGAQGKVYVVQTNERVIERCILMTTDPGDLVLDPTCGSGTTAFVAEQWGRRWITIDTSRVALALARARIMGARYPYYLLADSPEGQRKEGEVSRTPPKETPTRGDIRQGFVCDRVPHITLKSIANNTEIDVIWEKWQQTLEPLRARLNAALGRGAPHPSPLPASREREGPAKREGEGQQAPWEEWEIPRDAGADWPEEAKRRHAEWWAARIARQKEIDASIAAKAEFEYLYDKPYADNSRIRVAGPFTVESLSPHRVMAVDEDDSLIDALDLAEPSGGWNDFAHMVLDNLKTSGVQQAHKEDRITFTALTPWPGNLVCAEGRFLQGDEERRAAIFLGPEFGTVARADLVDAAREAADARFDVVIACAFNFDAHSAELERIGRLPILKARMNPDLHMAGELKNTGSGNLFVVFGEPDIEIEPAGEDRIRVRIKGVDVFKPQTGEIESGGPDTIAMWFIDTDYNEESFFVRHAYFLGAATDPYKALKTTLKAEIDEEAWSTLNSDTSRPFPKPRSGRIAVKVINHLGDEVMKVFSVR
jgi:adenine-specific DNA-methyltransferase